ncbi:MAG: hypothetical protein FJ253_09510 [Phycisphaerae bacterium]|nr:hypothetical protein [Phycisphaerae bacterium]
MLLLFDIDGTLLRTQGVGVAAMAEALRELHDGREFSFEGVEIAGRLDTLIWRDVMSRHGLEASAELHDRFRCAYARHLERRLAESPGVARLMPGVPALLRALRADSRRHLGLVTGNYGETGRLKIRASGLDPDQFTINAFADDGPDRRSLPGVALRRFRETHGRDASASTTVVIGDTPHDVDCARASGCLAVAVATGDFDRGELEEHRPDLVLDDLADTAAFLRWLESARA